MVEYYFVCICETLVLYTRFVGGGRIAVTSFIGKTCCAVNNEN